MTPASTNRLSPGPKAANEALLVLGRNSPFLVEPRRPHESIELGPRPPKLTRDRLSHLERLHTVAIEEKHDEDLITAP